MPSKSSKGAKRAVTKIIDALNGHDFKELQILVEKLQDEVALSKEVAQLLKENEDATEALYHHLKWDDAGELSDPVCKWFFAWYNSEEEDLQQFVLSFIPFLLWNYLFKSAHGKVLAGAEAVLACIYNKEAQFREKIRSKDNPAGLVFVSPPISGSSHLHSKPSASSSSSAVPSRPGPFRSGSVVGELIREIPTPLRIVVESGPAPGVLFDPKARAVTKGALLQVVLSHFRQQISYLPVHSKFSFINVCSRIASCGYRFDPEDSQPVEFYKFAAAAAAAAAAGAGSSQEAKKEEEEVEKNASAKEESGEAEADNEEGKDKKKGKGKKDADEDEDNNNNKDAAPVAANASDITPIQYNRKQLFCTSEVQQECVAGLACVLFNRETLPAALRALLLIQARAEFDLQPVLLLHVNAVVHMANAELEKYQEAARAIASK